MSKQHKSTTGFDTPTSLPSNAAEHENWQKENQEWWESNPMRYDWKERIQSAEQSREFFAEIDRRFFEAAALFLPPRQRPFDELIPFDQLGSLDVLEIGVGNGSHAQLIAPHCRSYTGIDLTDYAVTSTRSRLALSNLPGKILRMDAEQLEFADESFDFIWTWGVIHHSANTRQILKEMNRVLRPGGRSVVMVYHRSVYLYYIFNGLFRGIFGGGLLKTKSLHELVQAGTDGAIARFYSVAEWRSLVEEHFIVEDILIRGQKSELLPLPAGSVKKVMMKLVPNAISRFILNSCRQGSFLISRLNKP